MNPKLRIFLISFSLTLVIIFLGVSFWFFKLDNVISERLAGRRFLPPVEFYSGPLKVVSGQKLTRASLKDSLRRLGYHEKRDERGVRPGDFMFLEPTACQANLSTDLPTTAQICLLISKKKPAQDEADETRHFVLVAFDPDDVVVAVYNGEPLAERVFIELEPVLFAQFFGSSPIMRDVVELGDVAPQCLTALLAIEDSEFLEHRGVSATGILRAVYKNVLNRRAAQGGSTITQQLVKNYFLTPEKTLKRKITEFAMALLLESHATKDEILETYINEIYMGQNGTFEIRGFGAAATHYFGKEISELNLSECALLAALVNSPGLYNPFTKQENALKRRSLVLARMVELELILETDKHVAETEGLPKAPQRALTEPAPFFVEATRRELTRLGIDATNGLRIYTTLDLRAQEAAQSVMKLGLDRLESENKKIKKIRDEQKKSLEGALISADPMTGEIQAIVGGRSFQQSQFNRAIQSKRQVGSIFKPIVYLTALQRGIDGTTPTPLTLLSDERFTAKYDNQVWSPINYDKKTYGQIPMFFALKNSLNIATSSLAIRVGLNEIVEVAHDLGIESELRPVPSLALGAFEMAPFEVLQVYTTLARMGEKIPLTLIRRIEDIDGRVVYQHEPEPTRVSNTEDTAVLVGMMKQTVLTGTAWFMHKLGFTHPAAGKTGTTSDTKDAWFAGFTPYHAAIVWVGYDDNTQHGLTGASGAVPIWAEYMRRAAAHLPAEDFKWPEGVEPYEVSVDMQIDLNIPEIEKVPLQPNSLIFRSGTAPRPSSF